MAGIRPTEAISELIAALDRLDIRYFAGGSVASSIHGAPRFTQDLDLVVDLREEQIAPLVAVLAGAFYADEYQLREALLRGRSSNIIHLATGFKFDLFPLQPDEFHRSELERAENRLWQAAPDGAVELRIASAEDTVLQKLVWYRDGGCVSDRQWADVLGIVTIRPLDDAYLGTWAPRLGVQDLLAKLRAEAAQITSSE